MSSTVLLTEDKCIRIVPSDLILGWDYINDVREELKHERDMPLPIPLTDEECDTWLDLCIQGSLPNLTQCEAHEEGYYIEIGCDGDEVRYPMESFTLPLRSKVIPTVRRMNPCSNGWVMYCQLDCFEEVYKAIEEDKEAKKRVYAELGRVVRGSSVYSRAHPLIGSLRMDDNGDSGILFNDWELCYWESQDWETKHEELLGTRTEKEVEDDALCVDELKKMEAYRTATRPCIVVGIIYSIWLRMGCPFSLHWTDLDWNEFIKMDVAQTIFTMMSGWRDSMKRDLLLQEEMPPVVPQLISVLAQSSDACNAPLAVGVTSSHLLMRTSSIIASHEYQVRLGRWYERLFAERGKEEIPGLIAMANLHHLLMRAPFGAGFSPFALRHDRPTASTKRLLTLYLDFCQEQLVTFPDL